MSMPGNANLIVADGTPATRRANRRSALVAVVLSVLVPGLGHVYVGRAARGLLLFGMALGAESAAVMKLASAAPRFWPVAVSVAIMLVLVLFTAVEAAVLARKAQGYERKSYNTWYAYVAIVAAAAAIHIVICATLTKDRPDANRSFHMQPSSMEPTILRGDRLLAAMGHYRSNVPARGEVAIYRHPRSEGEVWIKRIVALEGDRVLMRDGRLMVNGAPVEESYVQVGDTASLHANTREVVVPAGHVFVLGDNRANSVDSRVAAHGPVPVANLIGRATDILWSRDLGRLGRWIGTPQ
jgi:signal peptidase I